MVKIVLEKFTYGYKILIDKNSFSHKNRAISKKLKLRPRQLIGYIVKQQDSNNTTPYLIALDMTQLNYWLSLGGQCSTSFLRFSYFLRKFSSRFVNQ